MKKFSLSLLILLLFCPKSPTLGQVIAEPPQQATFGWTAATISCNDVSINQFIKNTSSKVPYPALDNNRTFLENSAPKLSDVLPIIGTDGYASYWLRTGDSTSIKQVYPVIKEWLLGIAFDKKGLLKSTERPTYSSKFPKDLDFPVLYQTWYYQALAGASLLATATDNQQDIGLYEYRRQEFKDLFNEFFWKENAYKSSKNKTDERANALAIVAELNTTDKDASLRQLVLSQPALTPYWEKYMLESIFLLNQNEEAIRRIKEGISKLSDSTVQLDTEKVSVYRSLLSDYVAGIRPIEAAFKNVLIQPQLGSLTQLTANLKSPQGNIQLIIDYHPDNNSINMTVDLPLACKGIISLPILGDIYRYITCNHRLIFSNQQYVPHSITELDLVIGNEHYLNFEVSKGGRYVFEGR